MRAKKAMELALKYLEKIPVNSEGRDVKIALRDAIQALGDRWGSE